MYLAGWNIIAGPAGTVATGASGSLYTYQAGDSIYEQIDARTPMRVGEGYWAFLSADTTTALPSAGRQTVNVDLPAGQWILIGNPGTTPATVLGADAVYVYADGAGYQANTSLLPGQGAWAISYGGGIATISGS